MMVIESRSILLLFLIDLSLYPLHTNPYFTIYYFLSKLSHISLQPLFSMILEILKKKFLKEGVIEMNTLEAISKSSSHREYLDSPISEEQLKVLLEAGLCAPSSENEQPWYLIGILNKDIVDEIDRDIQAIHGDTKAHFFNAPAAILVAINQSAKTPVVDGATCTQNILLAAEDLNLASCWIDGILAINKSDKFDHYKQQFNIPDGYEFQTSIALGHRVATPSSKTPRKGQYTIIK